MSDNLRARLHAILDATRVPIDDDARALLEALLEAGARRMRDEDVEVTGLVDAEDSLRVLLGDMTQQVRILRLDVLGAPALASAIGRLCPLWPWC